MRRDCVLFAGAVHRKENETSVLSHCPSVAWAGSAGARACWVACRLLGFAAVNPSKIHVAAR